MRKLKTEVGRKLQIEREKERAARRLSLPASHRSFANFKERLPTADEQANRMTGRSWRS